MPEIAEVGGVVKDNGQLLTCLKVPLGTGINLDHGSCGRFRSWNAGVARTLCLGGGLNKNKS